MSRRVPAAAGTSGICRVRLCSSGSIILLLPRNIFDYRNISYVLMLKPNPAYFARLTSYLMVHKR